MNYLSFDIGTTGCKCQLFSENASILYYEFIEYDFKVIQNENYVNIEAIWHHLTSMLNRVAKQHDISSICISSLGESFVLLDKDDNILFDRWSGQICSQARQYVHLHPGRQRRIANLQYRYDWSVCTWQRAESPCYLLI